MQGNTVLVQHDGEFCGAEIRTQNDTFHEEDIEALEAELDRSMQEGGSKYESEARSFRFSEDHQIDQLVDLSGLEPPRRR